MSSRLRCMFNCKKTWFIDVAASSRWHSVTYTSGPAQDLWWTLLVFPFKSLADTLGCCPGGIAQLLRPQVLWQQGSLVTCDNISRKFCPSDKLEKYLNLFEMNLNQRVFSRVFRTIWDNTTRDIVRLMQHMLIHLYLGPAQVQIQCPLAPTLRLLMS